MILISIFVRTGYDTIFATSIWGENLLNYDYHNSETRIRQIHAEHVSPAVTPCGQGIFLAWSVHYCHPSVPAVLSSIAALSFRPFSSNQRAGWKQVEDKDTPKKIDHVVYLQHNYARQCGTRNPLPCNWLALVQTKAVRNQISGLGNFRSDDVSWIGYIKSVQSELMG